jgi:hypothetical protein
MWERFLIKDLSDIGFSIYENGKEKFSYKVNQFCKRLSRDAYFPDSKEYFWIDTTYDGPIPHMDFRSQLLLNVKCNKRFLINYRTGKIEQIKNPNIRFIGKNTDTLTQIILILVTLCFFSLISLRLKTKFLTYVVVLICCFLIFYISIENGEIAYRSIDKIFLNYFS